MLAINTNCQLYVTFYKTLSRLFRFNSMLNLKSAKNITGENISAYFMQFLMLIDESMKKLFKQKTINEF